MVRMVGAAEVAPTRFAWQIRTERLRVRAGRRLAVEGLTLSMGTGVHGVLGPNGAGKTTLIRAMATVLRPSDGVLELLGQSTSVRTGLRELRGKIGYLPQNF